jgi:hypothetical protein
MLEYVGDGSYILMVPARDITEEEIKSIETKLGWKKLRKTLLESGLYAESKPEPKTKVKED